MDVYIKRHGVGEQEFRQLKNLYYLGEYEKHGNCEWFTVNIDMSNGEVMQRLVLTWFLEWSV